MRAPLIAGALLAVAGLFILIRGLSYTREESVFKLGDFEAKVEQKHAIPEWVGGLAVGAGLVLVFVGMRRR